MIHSRENPLIDVSGGQERRTQGPGRFRITADANQFVVNRVRVLGPKSKNRGAERLVPLSYYLTFEQAIVPYLDQNHNQEDS